MDADTRLLLVLALSLLPVGAVPVGLWLYDRVALSLRRAELALEGLAWGFIVDGIYALLWVDAGDDYQGADAD